MKQYQEYNEPCPHCSGKMLLDEKYVFCTDCHDGWDSVKQMHLGIKVNKIIEGRKWKLVIVFSGMITIMTQILTVVFPVFAKSLCMIALPSALVLLIFGCGLMFRFFEKERIESEKQSIESVTDEAKN